MRPTGASSGIDYDSETAVLAGGEWGPGGPRGTNVEFAAMDGARLGFRTGSFDYVCSSHIIEHFTGPELHVSELARVSTDGGTTFVITPNRPADFENPFHVYLFEAAELASMLRLFFERRRGVGPRGGRGAEGGLRGPAQERREDLEAGRAEPAPEDAAELVRVELRARAAGRLQGARQRSERRGLRPGSHALLDDDVIVPTTPVLFAIARKPRRFPEH